MTAKEREVITDLKKCNFNEINDHFKAQSEARKNRTKEEKQVATLRWREGLGQTFFSIKTFRVGLLILTTFGRWSW